MNNKKGFTLIELIGVIVIIALLALIITPIVSTVLVSSKDKLYKNTLQNIQLSAKDWFTDEENIEKLPNNVDSCYITLTELKDAGIVDLDIKNPKTNELLDDTKVNVLVTKSGKSFNFEVVDDGSTAGGQCTEYAPNILAPTILATTFNDYRRSFDLNITFDNLTTTSGNTFEYYLSDSSNSLHGSSWVTYQNNVSQTIGTSKTGTYYVFVKRLVNVIDGQNNLSTLGGILVKINNETYHRFGPYRFDNTNPVWTFYKKTNSNRDMDNALENLNYAYKDNTVTITFRGTDENFNTSTLNLNNILINVGSTDATSSITKSLSTAKSLSNGVEYTLTLSFASLNESVKGDLSLVLPAGSLSDKAGNTNVATTISTKIKINTCKYDNGKTWSFVPNGNSTSTGSRQDFIVPCNGTYKIELAGAQGATSGNGVGGAGAKVQGEIVLKRNTSLYIYVGKQGSNSTGGYNGGGDAEAEGGGGGATDIRVGGTGVNNRILVAAGGGGGASGKQCGGGAGGDLTGSDGICTAQSIPSCTTDVCICNTQGGCGPGFPCNYYPEGSYGLGNDKTCVARYAQGGSQTAGGLHGATVHFGGAGVGGWAAYDGTIAQGGRGILGGGGGGGLYGGGGGAVTTEHRLGGAGGSSCISGVANYNCNNANFQFTNAFVIVGSNSGNGSAKITLLAG